VKPIVKTIASQPSWVVRNRNMELAVTKLGGQMAPVTFGRNTSSPVRPYYISPWQGEGQRIDDPVLVPLRGDFFCLPFGDNLTPVKGKRHVCHGQPASRKWSFRGLEERGGVTKFTLSMKTTILQGSVTKTFFLVDGHNVVYTRHLLEGYKGALSLGHHATLALPEKEGSVLISTSRFDLGLTCPVLVGDPAQGGYQSFAPGKKFKSLSRVPLLWKDEPFGDCTAFPVRKGFSDILGLFKKPGRTPAWTTAVNTVDGYLWFSMKDAALLPATVFWISNCGLYAPPLCGRNRCVGLEDVCGFLAVGGAESARPNTATRAGFPTAVKLSPRRPTAVHYIQGAVKVSKDFGRVKTVHFGPGEATFVSEKGKKVAVPVAHEFLKDEAPA